MTDAGMFPDCDGELSGTVAFTHLDGDYTGCAFSQEQDGTCRKTFPRGPVSDSRGRRRRIVDGLSHAR